MPSIPETKSSGPTSGPRPDDVFAALSTSGVLDAQFDEIMVIARDLRDRIDRRSRLSEMYAMMGGFIVFTGVGIAAWSYARFGAMLFESVYGAVSGISILYGGAMIYLSLRVKRRMRGDERALDRVAAIIGELLASAAKQGNWGPVTRAKYEIALSSLSR
jgi:hypothetical protein